MHAQLSANLLKQRIRVRMTAIGQAGISVAGSLVAIKRKCGRPGCQCAQGGEPHPAFLLTSKVRGKTKAIYVPVELVEDVKQWVQEHRKIKKLLKEIHGMSEQIIRQHVRVSRVVARNQQVQNPSSAI